MTDLPATSCALVVDENGTPELSLPKHEDEDVMPEHELFLAAVFVLMQQDPEFVKQATDRVFNRTSH